MRDHPARPRRYLGVELAGAKNQKTAVAALEFYPKERKVFLLDIYEKLAGDEALLELLEELRPGVAGVAFNVPLSLPPAILPTPATCDPECTAKSCPDPAQCSVSAIRWMHETTRRAAASRTRRKARVHEVTPYTQRPIELWIRYHVLAQLPESLRFEIDEALGGNKAPLTARMHYLRRSVGDFALVEAWPKLTLAQLAGELGLSRRTIAAYRNLEEGAQARELIVEALTQHAAGAVGGIFIYERDLRKLAASLAAFDAFLCAYTALLADTDQCARPPAGFPLGAGWVAYPRAGGG